MTPTIRIAALACQLAWGIAAAGSACAADAAAGDEAPVPPPRIVFEATRSTTDDPELRVGRVLVFRKEVFNPSVPGFRRFPFPVLNRFHIITRERVVREQILVKPGQLYDPELIEETERLLRNLSFIGAAKAVAVEDTTGDMLVVIETQDLWTTNLEVELERFKASSEEDTRDENAFEVSLSEANFLGYGKRIRARLKHEDGRDLWGGLYSDPSLFDTRWTAELNYQNRSFGEEWNAAAIRPFYSLDTRWSMGWDSRFRSDDNIQYDDGREIGSFFESNELHTAFLGRMFGRRSNQFLLMGDATHIRFEATPNEGPEPFDAPGGENGPLFRLGARWGSFRFREETHLERFVRIEDIEIGRSIGIEAGRYATNDPRWRWGAVTAWSGRLDEHRFLMSAVSIAGDRRNDRWRDGELVARIQYYERLTASHTLAGRLLFERGWNRRPGFERFIGDGSGLRGIESRDVAGQSLVLFNLEERWFTDLQLWTVAFGGAIFWDTGWAWDEDQPIRFSDLESSVGAGVRLGMTKSRSSPVVRIDAAWNTARGEFRFSVGSGHVFSVLKPYREFISRFP
ncbi:MAG: hypothetical protein HKN20_13285 [Gemmatimonadetes bacterium]|nr:hypothetical protein [Gemmatimonadota bacterium]